MDIGGIGNTLGGSNFNPESNDRGIGNEMDFDKELDIAKKSLNIPETSRSKNLVTIQAVENSQPNSTPQFADYSQLTQLQQQLLESAQRKDSPAFDKYKSI